MKDFIFLVGSCEEEKIALAKGLNEHYKGSCIEQNKLTSFGEIKDETIKWESLCLLLRFYYSKEISNIIALGFDESKTKEIPSIFKGSNFVILNLDKKDNKKLLPNEVIIDTTNKSKEELLEEAINIIDNYHSENFYEYEGISKFLGIENNKVLTLKR